ncbi:MAG: NAD(+)/NADH kinase [Actinomycetota bacterium]|nr:NAD(+)/NADH kinase [Actinomycetota bacterium]
MSTIVVVVNESRRRAVELAHEGVAWLVERGHTVRLPKRDAHAVGLDEYGAEPEELGDGLDLALSLGGDGTMLRGVHLAAPLGVPVLGVNLGRLGYLAVIEPDRLCPALERFDAGDYIVEERTMLCISVEGELPSTQLALNEAVLEKVEPGHTVHLAVSIQGRFFNSYVADAIILATPTGSTAYAFSAGGPIVSPRQEAVIITPVAPHTPFARALVVHPDEPVRVEVLDHRGATLTIDGRALGRRGPGDVVVGTVAPVPARFVIFEERDFYGLLKAKFGLADR